MEKLVHTFDNGVRVYSDQLLDLQLKRYSDHNVHEAEEEPVFLEAINSVKYGGKYVNVGAAIGYYPILAAIKRADLRIIAYEPLKSHRRFFNKNIALNGLSTNRIKIYEDGLYSHSGWKRFHVMDYSSVIREECDGYNILQQLWERFTNKSINCVTMEQLCAREDGEIDLLQMDIQGLEYQVLSSGENSLKNMCIQQFLIGTHSEELHSQCKDILQLHNYEILLDIYETQLQPDGIIYAKGITK